jgi:DNA-binding IscR family transcriptional regulator
MAAVKVSAKSDYAVRALLELAVAGEGPVKGERLAQAREIPRIAVRASLRSVVDEVTLADVVAGRLPAQAQRLTEAPDAWSRR